MLILGIETSGFEGSIALLRDDQCLGERHLNQEGRRHAQSLVLEMGELLQNHGHTAREVDLVAVSRGPGSFTGLRVGMICAKTFAYAAQCRFVAVDTFAAIAKNLPSDIESTFVIEDAQRDDLFVGMYQRNPVGDLSLQGQIEVVAAEKFVQDRQSSDVVTGPGCRKLDLASLPGRWLCDPQFIQPKASIIARLGRHRLEQNADDADMDFWKATPFYLRKSAAEEKRG